MSAIESRGENKLLVFFQDYLGRRPTGNDPPVSIKAKDLDKNYKLTTVIEEPDATDDDKTYRVEYQENGTVLRLERIPRGTTKGDLLYWDPSQGDDGQWVVLPAAEGNGLRVLTLQNGVLAWTETEDCEE